MTRILRTLEHTIGATFRNEGLLREALTHRSYLNENPRWPYPHNERLEYLGDAVLELVVSEHLFREFPHAPEGELTVLRAALVNYQMLSRIAAAIGLADFIMMSKSELKDTGKAREVILANAFEALVGALYLDQGIQPIVRFVRARLIEAHLEEILKNKSFKDPKSELQEIVQEKLKITPTYQVLHESGPAHQRTFRVGVYFGAQFAGDGEGSSKQEAELEAARHALQAFIEKKTVPS